MGLKGEGFFKQGGLYFWRWVPSGYRTESEVEQLVVSKKCREAILHLAHEVPAAGHLGRDKTAQRIL